MATHSSILAWEVPWSEEPGKLWSTELQRVRHDEAHPSIVSDSPKLYPVSLHQNPTWKTSPGSEIIISDSCYDCKCDAKLISSHDMHNNLILNPIPTLV